MKTSATPRLVPTASIRRHPDNPRRSDVSSIRSSIRELGVFYSAVVVQKSTGLIIAGNHRHEAAELEGLSEIPAVVVDVDDVTAKKIMLADNRLSDLGDYDPASMIDLLSEVQQSSNLAGTGYEDDDLAVIAGLLSTKTDASLIDAVSTIKDWTTDIVASKAQFSFSAPLELQARVRSVLKQNFPDVDFDEGVFTPRKP